MEWNEFIHEFLEIFIHPWVMVGIALEAIVIGVFIFSFRFLKNTKFTAFFDLVFEKVYDFFEDLLGKEERRWVKLFITSVFFVILFSNLLWVLLEFFLPIFGHDLEHYIKTPTTDINFNVAMSIVCLLLVLFEQFRHLGFLSFLHEYFPIKGKNYIPYEKGNFNIVVDIILGFVVKIFDILISIFLGLLEIVGLLAKVISLSFRLFGNMTSGWILLAMLFAGLGGLTATLLNFEFPIVFPLIVYLQEILVAFIQAFVFPLLVAIFIKVSKLH